MFRLYLEYARLISPDRDNGKMVRSLRLITLFSKDEAHWQDFVLEDRQAPAQGQEEIVEAGLPEGTIVDVSDR